MMYFFRFLMATSLAVLVLSNAELLQAQETTPPTTPPAITDDVRDDDDDFDWGWIGLLGLVGLGGLAGRRRDIPTSTTTRT